MADSSRVEELRKRYHENPRRFFAPLANEYRKGGFLDRAILLCQKHLGEQPGNMNGLIVYGQTLFESGRHEEARGPFESALEVDPENLIALRHLGDIARLSGDNAAARRWYGRVLEYDRRNEEVQALLDQVGGPAEAPRSPEVRPQAEVSFADAPALNGLTLVETPATDAPGPAASAPPKPDKGPSETLASAKTLEITPRRREATPAPVAATVSRAATPPRSATPAKPMRRASLLDIDFDFGELASQADAPTEQSRPAARIPATPAKPLLGAEAAEYGFSPTADLPLLDTGVDEPAESLMSGEMTGSLLDLPPEPESLASVTAVDGLEAADFEADVSPLDDLEAAEFDAGADVIAPLAELEALEFQVPDAGEPLSALPGLEGMEPENEFEVPVDPVDDAGMGEFEIESAATEPAILTPESLPAIDPTPFRQPTPAVPAASPAIVSETMAELYLEQGHRAEAIEVYRTLIAQDPTDEALRARLAALEEQVDAEPARQSMEFDVPPDATEDPSERPPENAMLAEVSFADLDLSTPAEAPGAFAAAPAAATVPLRATPAGPTAREFFAAFARRTLAPESAAPPEAITPPSGSWAVPAAISSLDDLFGVEVSDEDQRAANYLSGVGTTSAPSGTSSFDRLFASDSPAPAPRHSVPRASEKLKFDQFFSASSSTPPATPAAPQPEAASAPEPGTGPGAGGDDDDLDQFQGWLKGLTQ